MQSGALALLTATTAGITIAYLGAIRPDQPWSPPAVLIGCAAALTAPVLIGHTMATDPRWLILAADTVHVATAAIWIGGIIGISILLARPQRGRAGDAAVVVARFSTWAGYSVAALGVSGIAMAWAIHREWASLFDSDHGRGLLVKLGLVAVALALAAWNRYRLVPLIRGTDPGTGLPRLRRVVVVEAAVLAAVITVTGVLVNLSPGAESSPVAQAPTAPVAEPVSLVQPLGEGEARLEGSMFGIGEHSLALTLVDADGLPLEPLEAPAITASLPERDFGPVNAQIHEYGPGQYHCIIDLPLAGAWQISVQVRASEFESHAAVFDLTVR